MATQSLTHARLLVRPVSRTRLAHGLHLHIRKDILVIRLLLTVGFLIPGFMAFHFIPASFALLGIAFAMIAAGGVGWLIRCGEVA